MTSDSKLFCLHIFSVEDINHTVVFKYGSKIVLGQLDPGPSCWTKQPRAQRL